MSRQSPAEWIVKASEYAAENPSGVFVIPPGEYFFDETTPQLKLNRMGITLVGFDCTFIGISSILQKPLIFADKCESMRIVGPTIDFEPLPFTQGKVIRSDNKGFSFRVSQGFPQPMPGWANGVCKTLFFWNNDLLPIKNLAAIINLVLHRVDVTYKTPLKTAHGRPPVGCMVVLAPRTQGRQVVTMISCNGCEMRDLTIHSSPQMAFTERLNDFAANEYLHNTIVPKDDRLISINADAFHSVDCMYAPNIIGNRMEGIGDDGVNVNVSMHIAIARDGEHVIVLSKRNSPIKTGPMRYSNQVDASQIEEVLCQVGDIVENQALVDEAAKQYRLVSTVTESCELRKVSFDSNIRLGTILFPYQSTFGRYEYNVINKGYNNGLMPRCDTPVLKGNIYRNLLGRERVFEVSYNWLEGPTARDTTEDDWKTAANYELEERE